MTRAFVFGFVIAIGFFFLGIAHDRANYVAGKFKEWLKSFGGSN